MEIREATEQDVPQILNLLKLALGEVSSKKTEEVWNYKHVDNPFAKSFVMVATEGNLIIGLRAFMRWKWQLGDITYTTFRAVDTATHPDFRGKGIFKKLTLKAIEVLKETESGFIFNTPNDQSRPGYLKMGWKPVSKLKVCLYPNFSIINRGKSFKSTNTKISDKVLLDYNKNKVISNKLFTPKDNLYLDWRYRNNPMQSYDILEGKDFFAACYKKEHNRFNEYRIAELITSSKEAKRMILKNIKSEASNKNCLIISNTNKVSKISIDGKFGPLLVYRPLDLENESLDFIQDIGVWDYTLGDLELF